MSLLEENRRYKAQLIEARELNQALTKKNVNLEEEKRLLKGIILKLKPKFEELKKLNKFVRFFRASALATQLVIIFFESLKETKVLDK